ncbi:MAG: hypothetical protein ABGX24_02790 [Aquificota bacterium]
MFNGNGRLLEAYTLLKKFEKALELNLGVLEELQCLIEDNLEELVEHLDLAVEEERLFLQKLKGNLNTILVQLGILKDGVEDFWEDVEFTILYLVTRKEYHPRVEQIFNSPFWKDYQHKLDTLKDFIHLHWKIFEDDLARFRLDRKYPYDVYLNFLEKISEFNRKLR